MMYRRSFIKKSGLLAGGILLQNQIAKAMQLNQQPLKIAIIGCGDRGTGIIKVMHTLPDLFNVFAICDVLDFRLENAKKLLPENSYQSYTNYQDLMDNKDIDAVIICVTLSNHFQIAKSALLAGKHIYLEKTMTYNIVEAMELVALKNKYPKQILQIGHQYRYTPLYFKVKDMIKKGYLGKVTQVDCRWDRNSTWRRPVPSPELERAINWRMYKAYSGGLAAELLSHQIDFINWAFDTHPTQIIGTGGVDFYKDGRETYDNVQLLLRYNKENMIGNFGSTLANAHDGYLFKIKGTKGMVSLLVNEGVYYPEETTRKKLQTVDGVTGATKLEWNTNGGIIIEADKSKDGTWHALKDFYECISQKKEPVSNVITGATTAICVHLANKAMFENSIESWQPQFNVG